MKKPSLLEHFVYGLTGAIIALIGASIFYLAADVLANIEVEWQVVAAVWWITAVLATHEARYHRDSA